eukprot:3801544-Amphidinium_carterae.1
MQLSRTSQRHPEALHLKGSDVRRITSELVNGSVTLQCRGDPRTHQHHKDIGGITMASSLCRLPLRFRLSIAVVCSSVSEELDGIVHLSLPHPFTQLASSP